MEIKYPMNWKFPPIRSRISTLVALALLAMAPIAHAALIFERADVYIESPTPTAKEQAPSHPPLKYTVELRTEEAMRLEYIHTLNSLTPSTGVMITLDSPAMVPAPKMNVYTPVDVLFVDDAGSVLKIAPATNLSELDEPLQVHSPIKAFLFLKAGEAAARSLQLGDRLRGRMFSPPSNEKN